MMNRYALVLVISFLGCGGGDGSKEPDAALAVAPTITFTSHTDGERITGDRAVSLIGSIDGDLPVTMTATVNGAPTDVVISERVFDVQLDLADKDNEVSIIATNDTGTDTATINLFFPFLAFDDFEAAEVAIGQTDFASADIDVTANRLAGPYGNVAVTDDGVFVPDTGNHRVLYFSPIPTGNDASASFAVGQVNLTSNANSDLADGLYNPQSVAIGDGVLAVVDTNNTRTLLYSPIPAANDPDASYVVGQSAFGAAATECTADNAWGAQGAWIVDGKLLVADSENYRVLIWNSIPTANGVAADIVLGQGVFTLCESNDDNQDNVADATTSARTMDFVQDVWSDGTRLVVADTDNSRVLIWNTFPTASFTPADVVVGQSDFTSRAGGDGASGLDRPNYVTSNGNQLFIVDTINSRVLIYDTFPTANGAAADRVLGQGDFDHVTDNDDNQDNAADANPSARTLRFPRGIAVSDDALFVTDRGNNRILIFR